MKQDSKNHEKIIASLKKSLGVLVNGSNQAIYVYLDDVHKFCNEKYSKMLGFSSPEEWEKIEDSVGKTVAEKSQEVLIKTYTKAMEEMAGSHISVTWKRKDGKLIASNVILVPLPIEDEMVALHFIEKK